MPHSHTTCVSYRNARGRSHVDLPSLLTQIQHRFMHVLIADFTFPEGAPVEVVMHDPQEAVFGPLGNERPDGSRDAREIRDKTGWNNDREITNARSPW